MNDLRQNDQNALRKIAQTDKCPYDGTEFVIVDGMIQCPKCGWIDGPANEPRRQK